MQKKATHSVSYWVVMTIYLVLIILYIALAMEEASPISSIVLAFFAIACGLTSIVLAFRCGDRLRGFATTICVSMLGLLANVIVTGFSSGVAAMLMGLLAMTACFTSIFAVQEFLRESNDRDDHVRSMQDVYDAAAARDK